MPDSDRQENRLEPRGRGRRGRIGDVPENIQRRYYTDDRGGPGRGFYVDATVQQAAFRDRGDHLAADRADPNTIRDMAAIARHRGWRIVSARGSAEFRREAWLAGRQAGLEVRGYQPTERDLQALERRLHRRDRSDAGRGNHEEQVNDRRERAAGARVSAESRRQEPQGRTQMRVVEAVVRARVQDEESQRRILDRARARIADWLERGASFEPDVSERRSIERQRTR